LRASTGVQAESIVILPPATRQAAQPTIARSTSSRSDAWKAIELLFGRKAFSAVTTPDLPTGTRPDRSAVSLLPVTMRASGFFNSIRWQPTFCPHLLLPNWTLLNVAAPELYHMSETLMEAVPVPNEEK